MNFRIGRVGAVKGKTYMVVDREIRDSDVFGMVGEELVDLKRSVPPYKIDMDNGQISYAPEHRELIRLIDRRLEEVGRIDEIDG